MACPKGEVADQGQCWKPCPQGYTGFASQCVKGCPAGYDNAGNVCAKPILNRGDPIAPSLNACPDSLMENGGNCVSQQTCAYVLSPDKKNWVLQCTGTNTVAVTREQRQSCPPGYSLLNNMCYATCPSGYSAVGGLCAKDCPPGFKEYPSSVGQTGLVCIPPSSARVLGGFPSGGLTTIANDPNKTTLIRRFLANQSAQQSVAQVNTANARQAWDPTALVGSARNFLADNDDWLWGLIVIFLILVLIYLGPTIASYFNLIFSFLTPVAKGVGEAAGSAISGVGKVAEGALSATGKDIQAVGSATDANVQSILTQTLKSQTQQVQALQDQIASLQNTLNSMSN
jgi:hypothetical protein